MSERSKGLMDDWWAEKRADMTKVNIPAYITGSDFGSIHTMGAIRGWLQVNNPNKWIVSEFLRRCTSGAEYAMFSDGHAFKSGMIVSTACDASISR